MAIQLNAELERFAEQQAKQCGLRNGDEYIRKLVEADMGRRGPDASDADLNLQRAYTERYEEDRTLAEQWFAATAGEDDDA